MTVEQLVQKLAYEAGHSPADTEIEEQYRTWINDGIEEILAEGPWPVLNGSVGLTVQPGVAEYAVSAQTADIRAITETSTGAALTYVPPDEFVARRLRLDLPGKPSLWWYIGYDADQSSVLVRVWPTPTAEQQFTVFGHPRITAALALTATIPLPDDFLHVLRQYVRAMAAENQADDEGGALRATKAEDRYKRSLARLTDRFRSASARWSKMMPRDTAAHDAFGVPVLPENIS